MSVQNELYTLVKKGTPHLNYIDVIESYDLKVKNPGFNKKIHFVVNLTCNFTYNFTCPLWEWVTGSAVSINRVHDNKYNFMMHFHDVTTDITILS